jgi:vitamin B12/bleomycin/antimicrobial peptide transport system ATP-binding/permease protein
MQNFNSDFFRGMWGLTKTYWSSEEKWQARGLLAVIVGLNLGYIYLQVLFTEWSNTFYTAVQDYNLDACWSAFQLFCILATINIIVVVYMTYLQQMLDIKWRKWLTENYLGNWLQDRTYYQMRLLDDSTDNPDQRISEDLARFTSMTLSLSLGILRAVVTLISFIVILWRLSGLLPISLGSYQFTISGYLVWAALVYAVVGTWLTVKIGNPLVRLNFAQQRVEADFRFSMIRLRENSEGIAFYGGEFNEQSTFRERFRHVFDNFWQLMRVQKQLTWFTGSYSQTAIFIPMLLSIPRYFSRQITLGGLMQILRVFGHVSDALSFFVGSYVTIAEWQSVVARLTGFTNNMAKTQERVADINHGAQIITGDSKTFKVTDLDVKLPNNKILVDRLNLELATGDTLLIVGPSGSGKSTLMRAMAGIWPFGQGAILVPAGQSTLFLPQKPYLPLGTLRDVLLYPSAGRAVSDEGIKEIMRLCKLDWLKEHLDKVEDWSHVLSLGEQQRIAFARALLQQPKWLFLDEATSALDEPAEQLMYLLLKEKLPGTALISVGHRSTLKDFHKKKLTIDGSGKWSILH